MNFTLSANVSYRNEKKIAEKPSLPKGRASLMSPPMILEREERR